MNRKVIVATAICAALLASGCKWRVYAECSQASGCKAGGEVSGTFQMLDAMGTQMVNFDASKFSLDVSESNVVVPGSGWVTLTLHDSDTDQIQAAQAFQWVRSGNFIFLQNPAAANTWVSNNSGNANSLRYDLHQMSVSESGGSVNQFSVATVYDGQVKATSSTSWGGGGGDDCGSIAFCEIY